MANYNHSNEVKSVEVARYYLKSELGHILPDLNPRIAGSNDIESMPEEDVFVLCEALSIFYRLNSVWWVIGDPNFKWHKTKVAIEDVRLTGMGDDTEISKLIDSPEIQKDPVKLRRFLKDYYANLGSGKDKYKVQPKGKLIELDSVLLIQEAGKLSLLDGSHRFIEQVLRGQLSVNAFVAAPAQPDAQMKPVIGGGLYRNLVNVLNREKGENEKKMIRSLAKLLSGYSGRDSNPLKRFPDLIDQEESQNG